MTVEAISPYRACEEITRERAGNFYYGIRLLPGDKRWAMCAVYALARRIDDIADGDLPAVDKLEALASVRADLATIDEPSSDPVLAAVSDAGERFALPIEAFGELVDGVEMDVVGSRFETFEELEVYCRRVAGTIGRLSLAVFGCEDRRRAEPLADDLGVALQLTNILRDVREDGACGRVYLPQEDLERFGCGGGLQAAPAPAQEALVHFEAARARRWFDRGMQLVPLLDARSASCVATMSGIYRRLLEHIDRQPGEVMLRRVSLPAWEKAWVAAWSLAAARAGR